MQKDSFATSHSLATAIALLSRQARLLLRHLRYGPASLGLAPSARKAAALATLFRGVNAYLTNIGVDHCLAYGTLLGWHRGAAPLPHDRDIDFLAPRETFSAIWEARAKLPRGFTMHDTSFQHHGPKLYISYRGWEADIYFVARENGLLRLILVSDLPGDTTPFPCDYLYPLKPATFLGEPTFVPAQAVALLEHHYGYVGPDAVLDPVTRYYRPRS